MASTTDEPEEIRKDLESIKELLDEEALLKNERLQKIELADAESPDTADIPVLDDKVESDEDEALPESTFKTLLSDAWQDSVQELFNEARSTIELNRGDWMPEDTDELSTALKVRIDKSVREWLEETLRANIDLLRQRMVHELSEELLKNLRAKLDNETN
jgi:hypothetical protein